VTTLALSAALGPLRGEAIVFARLSLAIFDHSPVTLVAGIGLETAPRLPAG
jgi:hypothetical protein